MAKTGQVGFAPNSPRHSSQWRLQFSDAPTIISAIELKVLAWRCHMQDLFTFQWPKKPHGHIQHPMGWRNTVLPNALKGNNLFVNIPNNHNIHILFLYCKSLLLLYLRTWCMVLIFVSLPDLLYNYIHNCLFNILPVYLRGSSYSLSIENQTQEDLPEMLFNY